MSRGALLTGVAGGIIGTIASALGIIWSFPNLFYSMQFFYIPKLGILPLYTGPSIIAIIVTIIFVGLLLVSCILTGIGFYGMYTVGGGAMGVVGLIFSIIGGAAVAILILLSLITFPIFSFFYITPIWSWIGFAILGISFIIMGSASIAVRDYSMYSGTAVAAGILSIIGGCALFFEILFIFAWIGFGLMFVAFLLWAIVFYGTE